MTCLENSSFQNIWICNCGTYTHFPSKNNPHNSIRFIGWLESLMSIPCQSVYHMYCLQMYCLHYSPPFRCRRFTAIDMCGLRYPWKYADIIPVKQILCGL